MGASGDFVSVTRQEYCDPIYARAVLFAQAGCTKKNVSEVRDTGYAQDDGYPA
jgi:hypothetical protein